MTEFVDFDLTEIGKIKYLDLNTNLYRKLYLIRAAENKIIEKYNENEMKCPVHQSMGAEAISVGIIEALEDNSQIFSSYRSHAAYLAKTMDIEGFFNEMYGRDCSRLQGICGSMHISDIENDFMLASAIVASQIPVAVGAAYANKYLVDKDRNRKDKVVVVFFGDGAVEEGVFFESINLACLKKLKILFVCEDNGLAVHTGYSDRKGYSNITNIVSRFDCHTFESESTDVLDIYNLAVFIKELIVEKPIFLNIKYYRYLEHVGINTDFNAGYRNKDEFEKYVKERDDPIKIQRDRLVKLIGEDEVESIDREIDDNVLSIEIDDNVLSI